MNFEEWKMWCVSECHLVLSTQTHKVATESRTYPYKSFIGFAKKYKDKYTNALQKGLKMNMNINEYLYKIYESDIKTPSDMGNGMDKYCLGRNNDTGDYEVETCKFITGRDNVNDRIESGSYTIQGSNKAGITKKLSKSRTKAAMATSKGYYVTPLGTFYSANDAANVHGCSENRILNWCKLKNCDTLQPFALGRLKISLSLAGKTPKDLGWYYISK